VKPISDKENMNNKAKKSMAANSQEWICTPLGLQHTYLFKPFFLMMNLVRTMR
jgi:hypothetical protein